MALKLRSSHVFNSETRSVILNNWELNVMVPWSMSLLFLDGNSSCGLCHERFCVHALVDCVYTISIRFRAILVKKIIRLIIDLKDWAQRVRPFFALEHDFWCFFDSLGNRAFAWANSVLALQHMRRCLIHVVNILIRERLLSDLAQWDHWEDFPRLVLNSLMGGLICLHVILRFSRSWRCTSWSWFSWWRETSSTWFVKFCWATMGYILDLHAHHEHALLELMLRLLNFRLDSVTDALLDLLFWHSRWLLLRCKNWQR